MVTAGLAQGAGTDAARTPTPAVLWAIGVAGCVAAGVSLALALAGDHVSKPGVQATLLDWIILAYVFAGLIAWSRRPESRIGPLMIAAGFVTFLSTLSWANAALPYTVGQAFDLVPAVLFLHVFLAFPSGRLDRRVERALVGAGFETIRRATFFVIGLAPLAFLIGLLHARLARSAVGDLLVDLRGNPAPAKLRDTLARALRDPSLILVYWLPEFDSWADLDGQPVTLAELQAGRATTVIDHDGAPVAALLHDPSLDDEPELLEAVSAAAGIALENARLHVELRARLDELKGSRARIVEAGDAERRRLERDLHDGAQQRMVAVALQLRLVQNQMGAAPLE